MKRTARGLAMALAALAALPLGARELDTAMIERATGARGAWNDKEGVFKVSVARSDLSVSSGGVRITPAMGLTSWAAFQEISGRAMVMGDLVLLEDQVNPVMDAALRSGIEVTALHNHFFGEIPRVLFMHVAGMGEPDKLAAAVGLVFTRIRETAIEPPTRPRADIDPARTTLDPKKIETILGARAEFRDGVCKVVIGRAARMHDREIGQTMGVNTWAAFAGSDAKAVVDGDFAMFENELQGVLRALRGAGIDIVAIHSHMAGETPRVLFLHYWGIGPTEALAKGVKAALDTQAR